MKNKKQILSFPYIDYEEACLHLFEKMNQQGYVLTSIGLFFTFEKTSQSVKYQIDYAPRDTEYNEMVSSLGYTYIGSYKSTHFYQTPNLNAEDLVSDPILTKSIQLERYKKGSVLFSYILSCLFVVLSLGFILTQLTNKMNIYLRFDQLLTALWVFSSGIILAIEGYRTYKKRKSILEDRYSYTLFKKGDTISYCLLSIWFVSLFLIEHQLAFTLRYLGGYLLICFVHYLRNFSIPKVNTKSKRERIEFLLFIAYLIFFNIIHLIPLDSPTPTLFPYQVDFVTENPFIYRILFTDDKTNINGVYYECNNEEVTQEILHLLIDDEKVENITIENVDTCFKGEDVLIFTKDQLVVRLNQDALEQDETMIHSFLNYYKEHGHHK